MNTDEHQQLGSWQNHKAVTEAFEQGHLLKASRLLRQALVESSLSDTVDPLMVKSANQLAERYAEAGDYAGAASMYRDMLEVRSRLLGMDHPDVRDCRRMLAEALWQSGGLSLTILTLHS